MVARTDVSGNVPGVTNSVRSTGGGLPGGPSTGVGTAGGGAASSPAALRGGPIDADSAQVPVRRLERDTTAGSRVDGSDASGGRHHRRSRRGPHQRRSHRRGSRPGTRRPAPGTGIPRRAPGVETGGAPRTRPPARRVPRVRGQGGRRPDVTGGTRGGDRVVEADGERSSRPPRVGWRPRARPGRSPNARSPPRRAVRDRTPGRRVHRSTSPPVVGRRPPTGPTRRATGPPHRTLTGVSAGPNRSGRRRRRGDRSGRDRRRDAESHPDILNRRHRFDIT